MNFLKYTFRLIFITLVMSCGGDDGEDPISPPTPEPPVVENPEKAVLVFPINNEECNTGVSINGTTSKVQFKWNKSDNTTSYELHVKNLLSNDEKNLSTTSTELEIEINKNTPYKWWVISKSNTVSATSKSTEWKFYNSGDAVKSYAPFPAELVAPSMGVPINSDKVTLEWRGTDVDGDIKEYEVFFGTVNPPTEKIETTTVEKIEDISVNPSNYYWKVLTRDDAGNTSTSEVFQFKITS